MQRAAIRTGCGYVHPGDRRHELTADQRQHLAAAQFLAARRAVVERLLLNGSDRPLPYFRLARSRCHLGQPHPMQDEERISETSDAADGRGQWLSVPELAAKRRISEQSAARLVRRRRWQRQTDADNVIRILVPDATADTPNRPRGTQPAIEVLRMAVESLTERLRRADEDIRPRAGAGGQSGRGRTTGRGAVSRCWRSRSAPSCRRRRNGRTRRGRPRCCAGGREPSRRPRHGCGGKAGGEQAGRGGAEGEGVCGAATSGLARRVMDLSWVLLALIGLTIFVL